ncbi:hypothetical protein CRI94_02010 [Longibacter salinarum]|uniref:Mutator family transposase n=1 Tax=Longibacter salinarum TaxID=1850348 RepID=A0A2A8D2D4_9BACT|nr:hypothetical protein CRI94_02010 [Longibacter salinarum]
MIAMATFEITIDNNTIQDLLQSDQGLSALLGPILNQVLDAEMSEHLRAACTSRPNSAPATGTARTRSNSPHASGCSTWRWLATKRGTFKTSYQRCEKALVLALMQMVNLDLMRCTQAVSTRRVKKITTELCDCKFTQSTVSRLFDGLDEQVDAWAQRPLDG